MNQEHDHPAAAYKTFVQDTGGQCWRCGRYSHSRPKWYHAEFWIQRAHIVNKPRKLLRSVVIPLCSICHEIQHGAKFPQDRRRSLDLSELLAIKKYFDPDYYDEKILQSCSVQRLPEPAQVTFTNYFDDQIIQSSGVPGEATAKDQPEGDEPGRLEEKPAETDAVGSRTFERDGE